MPHAASARHRHAALVHGTAAVRAVRFATALPSFGGVLNFSASSDRVVRACAVAAAHHARLALEAEGETIVLDTDAIFDTVLERFMPDSG